MLLLISFFVSATVFGLPITEKKRLILWGEEAEGQWMTDAELNARIEETQQKENIKWVGYLDLTETPQNVRRTRPMKDLLFPTNVTQTALVNSMISKANPLNLNETLSTLENYINRFYNTPSGVSSAQWIHSEFVRLSQGSHLDIEVSFFNHPTWDQPSVIARIQGQTNEIIVMGAHIDSQAPASRAPGADDDGCGVATILEMFRLIVSTPGFIPKRTIEFMGYAAEEVGLRGSNAIATQYQTLNKDIYAVYQSEMCGWRGRTAEVVLIADGFTDPQLVIFSELLVSEYCTIPSARERCNSACSDHASWSRLGYSAICTAESGPSGDLNPYYHTSEDLLIHMDTDFALEFVKYGVGFAVELSLAD